MHQSVADIVLHSQDIPVSFPVNYILSTYCGSAMRQPFTPSKPRLWAASAAMDIVFTLLGARGHNSLTGAKHHVIDKTYIRDS